MSFVVCLEIANTVNVRDGGIIRHENACRYYISTSHSLYTTEFKHAKMFASNMDAIKTSLMFRNTMVISHNEAEHWEKLGKNRLKKGICD